MIYVIDEEPSCYQWILDSSDENGFSVTYCQSITHFLSMDDIERPCCIVSDLVVGDEQGQSLLSFLEERCLNVPVIFYATDIEIDIVANVMERGALTVLEKPTESEKLMEYIHSAIDADRRQSELGKIYCNVRNILESLTVRQKDVLGYMVQGFSTKRIADEFRVSQRLVEKERSEILRHFHVTATPDVTLMMGEYLAISNLWNHPRWRVATHGWPIAS